MKLTVPEVEEAIGVKARQWAGECYAVSMMILNSGLVNGLDRYGHWLGPVRKGTMFYGRPIVQHGWIEVEEDGKTLIVDATRWVFERRKPYIFIGEDVDGFYDIGGSKLRTALWGEPPELNENDADITHRVPEEVAELMTDLLGHHHLTVNGVNWIANQHPKVFGSMAKQVYAAIRILDMQALIPFDYQMLVDRS